MVERGCFDGREEDFVCEKGAECRTCRSNFCNANFFLMGSCIECKSDLNGPCGSNVTYLSQAQIGDGSEHASVDAACPIVFNKPLCYTTFGAYYVERGCYEKVFKPIHSFGCGPEMDCFYCDTELCNYWTQTTRNLKTGGETSGAGLWMLHLPCILVWVGVAIYLV